jgi:DNA-binding XRE family transcriptional regulator
LRAARESMGYSREYVAARLEVSSKTIERWEKNGGPRKRWQRRKLAALYEIDPSKLEEAVA